MARGGVGLFPIPCSFLAFAVVLWFGEVERQIMTLMLSCQRMKRLLAMPRTKRQETWAHDVCTASRFIHIDVWRRCAKHDEVENDVLPLLKEAKEELSCLMRATGDEDARNKICEYVANDEKRILNIENNYLASKPSGFMPDHMLSEPPAQAI